MFSWRSKRNDQQEQQEQQEQEAHQHQQNEIDLECRDRSIIALTVMDEERQMPFSVKASRDADESSCFCKDPEIVFRWQDEAAELRFVQYEEALYDSEIRMKNGQGDDDRTRRQQHFQDDHLEHQRYGYRYRYKLRSRLLRVHVPHRDEMRARHIPSVAYLPGLALAWIQYPFKTAWYYSTHVVATTTPEYSGVL